VLQDTHGLGRRDFLKALVAAAAGSPLLSAITGLGTDPSAAAGYLSGGF